MSDNNNGDGFTFAELEGVAGVTAVYVLLYYVFMAFQVVTFKVTQHKLGKPLRRFDHRPKFWRMGDRTFQNLIEQSIPFLASLWVHALFVSPRVSEALGAVYIVFRLLYPLLWAVKQNVTMLILISTMPGYTVIASLGGSAIFKTLFGVDIPSLTGPSLVAQCFATVGIGLVFGVVVVVLTGAYASLTYPAYKSAWPATKDADASDSQLDLEEQENRDASASADKELKSATA